MTALEEHHSLVAEVGGRRGGDLDPSPVSPLGPHEVHKQTS